MFIYSNRGGSHLTSDISTRTQYSTHYFLIIVHIQPIFSDFFVYFEAMLLIVFQLRTFVFSTFFFKASIFHNTTAKFIVLAFFFSLIRIFHSVLPLFTQKTCIFNL